MMPNTPHSNSAGAYAPQPLAMSQQHHHQHHHPQQQQQHQQHIHPNHMNQYARSPIYSPDTDYHVGNNNTFYPQPHSNHGTMESHLEPETWMNTDHNIPASFGVLPPTDYPIMNNDSMNKYHPHPPLNHNGMLPNSHMNPHIVHDYNFEAPKTYEDKSLVDWTTLSMLEPASASHLASIPAAPMPMYSTAARVSGDMVEPIDKTTATVTSKIEPMQMMKQTTLSFVAHVNIRIGSGKRKAFPSRDITILPVWSFTQLLFHAANISTCVSVRINDELVSENTVLNSLPIVQDALLNPTPRKVELNVDYELATNVKSCTRLGCQNLLVNKSNRRACNFCQTQGADLHPGQICMVLLPLTPNRQISSDELALRRSHQMYLEMYLDQWEHWKFDASEIGCQYIVFIDEATAKRVQQDVNQHVISELASYSHLKESVEDIPLRSVDTSLSYTIRMRSHFWMLQVRSFDSGNDNVSLYKKLGKPNQARTSNKDGKEKDPNLEKELLTVTKTEPYVAAAVETISSKISIPLKTPVPQSPISPGSVTSRGSHDYSSDCSMPSLTHSFTTISSSQVPCVPSASSNAHYLDSSSCIDSSDHSSAGSSPAVNDHTMDTITEERERRMSYSTVSDSSGNGHFSSPKPSLDSTSSDSCTLVYKLYPYSDSLNVKDDNQLHVSSEAYDVLRQSKPVDAMMSVHNHQSNDSKSRPVVLIYRDLQASQQDPLWPVPPSGNSGNDGNDRGGSRRNDNNNNNNGNNNHGNGTPRGSSGGKRSDANANNKRRRYEPNDQAGPDDQSNCGQPLDSLGMEHSVPRNQRLTTDDLRTEFGVEMSLSIADEKKIMDKSDYHHHALSINDYDDNYDDEAYGSDKPKSVMMQLPSDVAHMLSNSEQMRALYALVQQATSPTLASPSTDMKKSFEPQTYAKVASRTHETSRLTPSRKHASGFDRWISRVFRMQRAPFFHFMTLALGLVSLILLLLYITGAADSALLVDAPLLSAVSASSPVSAALSFDAVTSNFNSLASSSDEIRVRVLRPSILLVIVLGSTGLWLLAEILLFGAWSLMRQSYNRISKR